MKRNGNGNVQTVDDAGCVGEENVLFFGGSEKVTLKSPHILLINYVIDRFFLATAFLILYLGKLKWVTKLSKLKIYAFLFLLCNIVWHAMA